MQIFFFPMQSTSKRKPQNENEGLFACFLIQMILFSYGNFVYRNNQTDIERGNQQINGTEKLSNGKSSKYNRKVQTRRKKLKIKKNKENKKLGKIETENPEKYLSI